MLVFPLILGIAVAQPAYELDPVTDGAILAATLAIGLAERRFLSLDSLTAPQCTLTAEGLCDPSELHPLDAAVVGRWNEDWGMGGFFKILRGKNNCQIEDAMINGGPVAGEPQL